MARFFTLTEQKDKPSINSKQVADFFDSRSDKIQNLDSLRVVMYQDKNPDLVISRDIAEKDILLPKLKLGTNARILDVGCGTGRWLDCLSDNFEYYHGIDISKGFISYAQNKFNNRLNINFSVNEINELDLKTLGVDKKFNLLLCMGVLIYINDCDLIKALKSINVMMSDFSQLVFREPISVFDRLTLVDEYSEDMQQNYSAIYRTKDELIQFFNLYLDNFKVVESKELFNSALNNRKETQQYYFILESHCE